MGVPLVEGVLPPKGLLIRKPTNEPRRLHYFPINAKYFIVFWSIL